MDLWIPGGSLKSDYLAMRLPSEISAIFYTIWMLVSGLGAGSILTSISCDFAMC